MLLCGVYRASRGGKVVESNHKILTQFSPSSPLDAGETPRDASSRGFNFYAAWGRVAMYSSTSAVVMGESAPFSRLDWSKVQFH
jgi:hypothetical protein